MITTDLSVSGEKGHSTILLAHYIFCFFMEDKVILLAMLATPQSCTKMLRNRNSVVQFAYFSIRPKKVFAFSSNFRYKKQLLSNVLRN